ncbi:Na+/H+ antiporter NhaC family protein [Muribaculum intestinale]|jgi:Na+/H+ antiporter NhaC|uniref:Na+/H+ antiporter NhaC family protein n=1 Tax=Muribaculum intestinale TaxID=1796646 RepID=UPI002431D9AD|nr:Na+/H+ antiporter NhaC family protein [Muribaculum intestinale]
MKESPAPHIPARRGLLAISPILVFLFFYLAVSVIIGDFYKMPIAVALLLGSAWAVVIMHGKPLSERVEIFSRDAGSSNVMYMVWIFILAGAFAAIAREIGAIEATVHLALRFLPVEMLIPGLFAAACFISLAIGTSVGTVVALTPLAVELAQSESGNVPFFVAVVLGGAFFGDNLSFISDTTIAATRTQGCRMRDKFRVNLWIALPAAVASLILYVILGVRLPDMASLSGSNPLLVAPYLLIILLALAGLNVTVVLSIGIVVAIILGLCTGHDIISLFGFMGRGIDSVGQLIIITLLAAGMLGLIKAAGGIDYILQVLTRRIRGPRGAQAGIALVVGLVNLCTANNTVAIITVGQLASSLSKRFGVDPRKAASLLDTSSCIVQSLIPYGAQTLLATSLASISPVATWPYLYYPWALAVFLILSVVFRFPRLATISPPVSTNDNTNP